MGKHMTSFRELVARCIGEASVCWSEWPSGVFDSSRAEKLVDAIVREYEKLYTAEQVGAIAGATVGDVLKASAESGVGE